ncbi:hydroxyacylglutathione hydrolase [Zooshikella harenae]|uniref:Hydroxyacylglutathione hydrolase n=1 Tax=Zooshikella harenae TaxID=2827238 RepID=A0ABS5ZC32_9GAMM|nr:hydroxyacylglutathione hydrolase [Zooshikella harenae]MBU2711609.1 hydroxyacylglutathione hydrolase [Zooshikella harenae]
MLSISPIPAFNDNYIWLISETKTNKAWVVDPGDAKVVIDTLQEKQLQLEGILITHHHFDHVGGLKALKKLFKPVTYGPKSDAIHDIDVPLSADDTLTVLEHTFKVIAVPGHTLDHIAYFSESHLNQPVLFCGDTLFAGGCGRLFEGTAQQLYQSLQQLTLLPANTLVYCAHEYTQNNLAFAHAVEPDNTELNKRRQHVAQLRNHHQPTLPSTIADELSTNPFLRCAEPSVKHRCESHIQQDLVSPIDVFATLRRWKDHF